MDFAGGRRALEMGGEPFVICMASESAFAMFPSLMRRCNSAEAKP